MMNHVFKAIGRFVSHKPTTWAKPSITKWRFYQSYWVPLFCPAHHNQHQDIDKNLHNYTHKGWLFCIMWTHVFQFCIVLHLLFALTEAVFPLFAFHLFIVPRLSSQRSKVNAPILQTPSKTKFRCWTMSRNVKVGWFSIPPILEFV